MKLTSNEIEFLMQIGYMFIQLERWEDAVSIINLVLDSEPDNIDAQKLLAYGFLYWGKLEMSIKLCDRVSESVEDRKTLLTMEKIRDIAMNKLRHKMALEEKKRSD